VRWSPKARMLITTHARACGRVGVVVGGCPCAYKLMHDARTRMRVCVCVCARVSVCMHAHHDARTTMTEDSKRVRVLAHYALLRATRSYTGLTASERERGREGALRALTGGLQVRAPVRARMHARSSRRTHAHAGVCVCVCAGVRMHARSSRHTHDDD
jgi:hypothetical protein